MYCIIVHRTSVRFCNFIFEYCDRYDQVLAIKEKGNNKEKKYRKFTGETTIVNSPFGQNGSRHIKPNYGLLATV